MKTTAEEKLMRSLEQTVEKAAHTMTRSEFAAATKSNHEIAVGVIRSHQRMIGLWSAMDKRIQKRARKYLNASKPGRGENDGNR